MTENQTQSSKNKKTRNHLDPECLDGLFWELIRKANRVGGIKEFILFGNLKNLLSHLSMEINKNIPTPLICNKLYNKSIWNSN